MHNFAQLFTEETVTFSHTTLSMTPLYGIVTDTIVLRIKFDLESYPFSLACLPNKHNVIGWKTTPEGEIALFERNFDNTISVEVRTCLRTSADVHLSFAEFKARQSWRDALEVGEEEYHWLLARSDYALRGIATVQSEKPTQTDTLQLFTREQERELYRDLQSPLEEGFGYAQDEDRDETTAVAHEATPQQEKASLCETVDDDVDDDDAYAFENDFDDDEGSYDIARYPSVLHDTEMTPSIEEAELSEDATLMDEDDEEVDTSLSNVQRITTKDYLQAMHAEVTGTPYYNAGDYAFVFDDAGVMVNAGSSEPPSEMTLRDADGEGMETRSFKGEPVPPSQSSKETKRATPRKVTVKAGKAAMSCKQPKKSSRTAKQTSSKAAKAPKALSSQWKCSLCPFRPAEGKDPRQSVERHMKGHEDDPTVCVCLGAGGCGKTYTRHDAHTRHLKDKQCHGECVVMRKSAYLEKFPGNEKRLKATLKKRRKNYA